MAVEDLQQKQQQQGQVPRRRLTRKDIEERKQKGKEARESLQYTLQVYEEDKLCFIKTSTGVEAYEMSNALFAKTAELFRAAHERDPIDLGQALRFWAQSLCDQNHFRHAEVLLRESLEVYASTPKACWCPVHETLLFEAEMHLATVLRQMNRLTEADTLYRQALDRINKMGPNKKQVERAGILWQLSEVCLELGQLADAEKIAQEGLTILKPLQASIARSAGQDFEKDLVKGLHSVLGGAYEKMGRHGDSLKEDLQAFALKPNAYFDEKIADTHRRLTDHYLQLGDMDAAERFISGIYDWYTWKFENSSSMARHHIVQRMVRCMRVYVKVLVQTGQVEKAEAVRKDVDETEAVILGLERATMEELREEMAQEKKEKAGASGGGKKKLNRKQQKRKAAAKRKQQEQQQQQQQQQEQEAVGGGGKEGLARAVDALTLEKKGEGEAAAAGGGKQEKQEQKEEEDEEEEQECSVCLEEVQGEEGDAVLLVCSHIFHATCLQRWEMKCIQKERSSNCPMCRENIVVAAKAL